MKQTHYGIILLATIMVNQLTIPNHALESAVTGHELIQQSSHNKRSRLKAELIAGICTTALSAFFCSSALHQS